MHAGGADTAKYKAKAGDARKTLHKSQLVSCAHGHISGVAVSSILATAFRNVASVVTASLGAANEAKFVLSCDNPARLSAKAMALPVSS